MPFPFLRITATQNDQTLIAFSTSPGIQGLFTRYINARQKPTKTNVNDIPRNQLLPLEVVPGREYRTVDGIAQILALLTDLNAVWVGEEPQARFLFLALLQKKMDRASGLIVGDQNPGMLAPEIFAGNRYPREDSRSTRPIPCVP